MERVTNNRSLEAERYGRAHSSVRHRRSMMNVGGRTHGGRRRNEQRAVDSIDVNACSCSLHVLSNVPLHSRLVFFFFFTPLSLPFFFPARRLFLLLIFFPVLIMDGLVALLTRDIEARRINTAVSSNKFVIFNFHPSSPSISKPHPFLPESRKLLSKLLQLLSVGGLVARLSDSQWARRVVFANGVIMKITSENRNGG